jgi:hypothetical protein
MVLEMCDVNGSIRLDTDHGDGDAMIRSVLDTNHRDGDRNDSIRSDTNHRGVAIETIRFVWILITEMAM